MQSLTLLIKPASSRCNLRCRYCFYLATAGGRNEADRGIMTEATLETVVRRALDEVTGTCVFAFQGGEPLLAGLPFFEALLRFEKQYNHHGTRILHTIQTNGVLLDDTWATFLADNGFLVGLSIDGPRDRHDLERTRPDGSGSHAAAERAAGQLQRHGAEFNILSVVTDASSRHARKIYRYFRRRGFAHLQFIPCLDAPSGEHPGLSPGRYAPFLCALFDEWFHELEQGTYVSVRLFDNLVRILQGLPPEACDQNGVCSLNPVVEADGRLYPCDFYADDEWEIGSVLDESRPLPEVLLGDNGRRFLRTSPPLPADCADCPWLALCRGGCRRMRDPGPDGRYRLCGDLKTFYEYAGDRLARAATLLSGPRPGTAPIHTTER